MSQIKLKEKEHRGNIEGTLLTESLHLEILGTHIKLLCF